MKDPKRPYIIRISVMIIAIMVLFAMTAIKVGLGETNDPALTSAAVDISDAIPAEQGNPGVPSPPVTENISADSGAQGGQPTVNTPDVLPADALPDDRTEEENDAASDATSAEQTDETSGAQSEVQSGDTDASDKYKDAKIAYITIDDGPSRAITPGILDVLAQEGIKATFFVLPHDGVRDLYQRIIDEGHEIGNHSYTHVYSKLYSSDLQIFKDDVLLAREWLFENFGYLTTTFRFPGGMMGRSSATLEPRRAFLDEVGYRYFDWNSDTGDARSGQTDKSAAALTANVLRNTNGRERLIVIMHDTGDKRTTLEALPRIISGLREQGYVFDILRNYDDPDPQGAAPNAATPTSLA